MLKLSLIAWLLCSLTWRTTPTSCHRTQPPPSVEELLANRLHSYMDLTARPCENFYQYACGNWPLQQMEQPPETQQMAEQQQQLHQREQKEQLQPSDTLAVLDYALNRQLEQLLRRGVSNDSSTEDEQLLSIHEKMHNYYRACKRLKPYNLKKYLQLLPPSNCTGWPLLSRKWSPETFSWLATIGRLRSYGLNGVLLKEEVLPRWDDASSYAINLDKPSQQETIPMGEGAIIELLLDIGQTKREANVLARQVDFFERQLHRLQDIEDDMGNMETELCYLAEIMPQLQWTAFIQELPINATASELERPPALLIQNVPYMRALDKFLRRHKPETVCNYIMLKLLAFLKQQGPAEISRVECVASLRRAMPLAASLLIGQRFHDPNSEPLVSEIFGRLKRRFGQLINENRLQLKQPILRVLQEKLDAMRLQLGFLQLNETSYVDDYYEPVQMGAQSFYENQLALLRLRVERNHQLLTMGNQYNGNNVSYLTERELSSSLSPFFALPRNLVLVPYGFLQLPIWHRNMSELQQHAVLGFILAHEIIHGFDNHGIHYDSVGNLMGPSEEIWASPRYNQSINCIEQHVATGSKSLSEKIADFEAMRLVYETYFGEKFSIDRKEPRDPLLPQFSQRQRFFISFAQFFCGKQQSLNAQHLEHAVDELRVLQTLANFEEFSREFGCEKRTKMQAKKKCRVW
ncbi:PREDICTED: membrane metallo-endopeptidase-like 1 [Drosophila arizonae]|uniref:Membrane metallo-endopeptidase-like 1 n=1 Tax=Drosophila arizonae TaxID=7263 RepID=A0ABM1NYD2_DROAR|nr:PREDICTED: membrane metallo-endopeptidase-like 1 [Drosophila arizonae]